MEDFLQFFVAFYVGADYFELSKTNSFIEYYTMIIRSVGRSENPGKGATNNVVGIICHPGWNRVSLPAKIWEGAMPPQPLLPNYESPNNIYGMVNNLPWFIVNIFILKFIQYHVDLFGN